MLRLSKWLKFSVFFIFCSIVFWLYTVNQYYSIDVSITFKTLEKPSEGFVAPKYLVWGENCRIPNVDPFNSDVKPYYFPIDYQPCTDKELLTYITKVNNTARLHINETLFSTYSYFNISCCYSEVTRLVTKNEPDRDINISKCIPFESGTIISGHVVKVECRQSLFYKIYENVHSVVTITNEMKKKVPKRNKKPLSVLFVGIDSISALNLVRTMPKTHRYLEDNDWIGLKGYNKVADNTFPNLMAILTGMNDSYSYETCNPKMIGKLEQCNLLWYTYRKLGYITAYGEDEASISTFNYIKKGFIKPPTDFYFRPYVLAAETLHMKRRYMMSYCTGPETSGERILNLAKDFSLTFKDYPNFGFFWMNSFSHDESNAAGAMDGKIKEFLKYIKDSEILDNSIVILISDHGFRFGDIRYTYTGWLEERLPFIYISLPKWFQNEHPNEVNNIKVNANRLTTPYDLYMTLQDVLVLSGYDYKIQTSDACPKCKSLFKEMDENRSCKDAGILRHWCTCYGHSYINPKTKLVSNAANYVIKDLNQVIKSFGEEGERCSTFYLKEVVSSGISEMHKVNQMNETFLLLIIKTVPEAVFEATLSVTYFNDNVEPAFKLQGNLSRIDIYGANSKCVKDSILKKYCYCQGYLSVIKSAFCILFNCV